MDAQTLEVTARASCTARSDHPGFDHDGEQCRHEHSHILDSKTHGSGYAGPQSRKIFCSHCRLQRWLDVEAALAMAQADVNIIPREAALEIEKGALLSGINVRQLAEGVAATGHSLMPLLRDRKSVV